MYTSMYTASTQSCTRQVGLHGRVHGPRVHVAAVGRVHGRNAPCMYTVVYTSHRQPCTCSSTRAVYTARTRPSTRSDTARTRPCTRPVHSRIHGPCTWPVHGSVNVRVHGPSCTWQVGLPGHVHVPRRHATAVCGPSRPCTRPAHSPFTAVYTAVYDGR